MSTVRDDIERLQLAAITMLMLTMAALTVEAVANVPRLRPSDLYAGYFASVAAVTVSVAAEERWGLDISSNDDWNSRIQQVAGVAAFLALVLFAIPAILPTVFDEVVIAAALLFVGGFAVWMATEEHGNEPAAPDDPTEVLDDDG